MGVVYHASYIPYFEIGRVEWLRNLGISYKGMEQQGIALPIVSMKIDYRKPARYDDLLTVITRFKLQNGVKIAFDCEIQDEQGTILTTGYFLLVFVDIKKGKPCLPSTELIELFQKLASN
jgi:acyl-CoA thioester hydrolase